MDVWESLLRMVSALAVVMVLMLACAYVFRRLQGTKVFTVGTVPLVKVLASGYLGSRKNIVLVNVAGEVLIVGTTADGMVPLGRLSNPERIGQLCPSNEPANQPLDVTRDRK